LEDLLILAEEVSCAGLGATRNGMTVVRQGEEKAEEKGKKAAKDALHAVTV
jgi:hypothetical protein